MPIFTGLFLSVAMASPSASTTASSEDSRLTVTGIDGHARHTHGGPPAAIGHARFQIQWRGEQPVRLTVTHVDFLIGHDCEHPPATVSSSPKVGGLILAEGMVESAKAVTLTPNSDNQLTVGFPAVSAYYTHCDRFAFRVTFQADDLALTALAETNVMRVEPYDRPR
ncbi:MAG: hypothetical protein AAFV53_27650 [Myxococcota bacterium]